MHVVIQGAGIGGLTAAVAFLRRGHRVTLIDHQDPPRAHGAGLIVHANAAACLIDLGLGEALREHGLPIVRFAVTNDKGAALSALELPTELPSYTLDRPTLHHLLHRHSQAAERRYGTSIARWDGCTATLESGETLPADRLVAADGIGSALRRLLLAEGAPAVRYAGYTCYRAVVSGQRAEPVEMWGQGRRVGLVPLRGDRIYTYLCANAPAHSPTPTVAQIQSMFRGFGPETCAVLDQLTPEVLLHHDLAYLDRHVWLHDRVAFLGDAAHAFTPNMGQGAAMAIEDAWQLAQLEDWSTYPERRRTRVAWVSDTSQQIGNVAQWSSPLACLARDWVARLTPAHLTQRNTARLWREAPANPARLASPA